MSQGFSSGVSGSFSNAINSKQSIRSTITSVTITSGVATINLSLTDTVYEVSLTENLTSWSFTNLPASGVEVEARIRIKQHATNSYTCVSPSTKYDAWKFNSKMINEREIVIRVNSSGDRRIIDSLDRINNTLAKLYAGGRQGFYIDLNDWSTLWQDTTATTPVTALGQTVARIDDKSGNGNYFVQTTPANRGTIQQDEQGFYYILMDGTNDSYNSSATLNLTSSDKVIAATASLTTSMAEQIIMEHSANWTGTTGTFMCTSGFYVSTISKGSGGSGNVAANGTAAYNAPITEKRVIVTSHNIVGDTCQLMMNDNLTMGQQQVDKGTGNFGNHTHYLGSRANTSFFFSGRIYGAVVIGGTYTYEEIEFVQKWLNMRIGAF